MEYISGLFFDITERKELEATVAERTLALQQANDRLMMNGTSRDILMQSADVALYRAKQEGRDRVCVAENR